MYGGYGSGTILAFVFVCFFTILILSFFYQVVNVCIIYIYIFTGMYGGMNSSYGGYGGGYGGGLISIHPSISLPFSLSLMSIKKHISKLWYF